VVVVLHVSGVVPMGVSLDHWLPVDVVVVDVDWIPNSVSLPEDGSVAMLDN